MSHSKKRHEHKEGKKPLKDIAPVSKPENDESLNPQQTESSKPKSFDEIIKGFKEIKKIDNTESPPASQTENEESGKTKQNGSPKSKSYAEIIKGFQEIEKIISNSQNSE